MGDGDGSAAAFKAALGLNLRYFVDYALDIVDDISRGALQYARQEAATARVLGAAKAAQKAAEPDRDNSCAKESLRDGTSNPDLDLELDLSRKKLETANKESENLRRELSLLERQTTYKRELDSSVAEIQKLFEEKSVQQKFEDLAKAIPILQQKMISLNKKRTETGSLVDLLRNTKRPALDKDFTARTEDIQEVVNILQNK